MEQNRNSLLGRMGMDTDDPAFAGVAALGALYRSGRLTPRDAVAHALARLERLEPHLNAFADPMREAALRDAGRRGAELASGRDLGPLHGIPVAVKDIVDVAGVPTGFGTRAREPEIASSDAELVRRLRAAGAVILGKTNLLEFAYGIAHPEVGQTNNPHDFGRTSGGSSGGSAAAVAAGVVPLAVGTDTGGSIRIPAAYCGIVGMKPSHGLVPVDGVFPLSWTLDHAGPLARGVEDAALMLACLAGQPMPVGPVALAGLRIGLVRRHMDSAEITAGVRDCLDKAMSALARAGARPVEIDIAGLDQANDVLRTILRPEASLVHAELVAKNPSGYAPRTRAQVEAGFGVAAVDYVRAMRARQALRGAVEASFADVDVLLGPSVPFVAPREDPEIGDGEDGEMLSSGFANVSGHPSVGLPAGMSEGLPVGIQLTGRFGRDAALLSIARSVESALGGGERPRAVG
jgi:aspartyl-tRNA(Asn)/glutamyl-tRNA(Gln) amidotransferase subunit A